MRATYSAVGTNIENAARAAEIPQRAATAAREAAAFPGKLELQGQEVIKGRESITPEALTRDREMAAAKLTQAQQEVEQNKIALAEHPEDRALKQRLDESLITERDSTAAYRQSQADAGGVKPVSAQGKSSILGQINTLAQERAKLTTKATDLETKAGTLFKGSQFEASKIAEARTLRQRIQEIDTAMRDQRSLLGGGELGRTNPAPGEAGNNQAKILNIPDGGEVIPGKLGPNGRPVYRQGGELFEVD